jgi:hypothetical protein
MSFATRCWWKVARGDTSRKSSEFRGVRFGKYLEKPGPIRTETVPRRPPVWEAVGPRLEALLAESVRWTGGKQQLTATRLHEPV